MLPSPMGRSTALYVELRVRELHAAAAAERAGSRRRSPSRPGLPVRLTGRLHRGRLVHYGRLLLRLSRHVTTADR